MTVARLSLTNFRSYRQFTRQFEQTTAIVGPNGVGKTNLLEAIVLLSILKSYRTVSDAETIRFGEEFAKIVGRIEHRESRTAPKTNRDSRGTGHDELEVVISKGAKKAKRNGAAKPLSQLIGTLKTVLFSPEQLDIVTGPPRRRRRFWDSLLSQVDHRYTRELIEYQRSLHQRNALLIRIRERRASPAELAFWDDQLIKAAAVIHEERKRLVDALNRLLPPLYQAIAGSPDVLSLLPRFSRLSAESLTAKRPDDIAFGVTTIGPHRDNFTLAIGVRDLAQFGSRGEWRSALFALKAAEREYLAQETKTEPVLLLDDVFSELDRDRRERLLSQVGEGQMLLTATDLAGLPTRLQGTVDVLEVANYAEPVP